MISHRIFLDDTSPHRDHGNANASLIEIALDTTQTAVAVEKDWVSTSFLMGTVVACENDERLVE